MRLTEIKKTMQCLLNLSFPLLLSGLISLFGALCNIKILGKHPANLYLIAIFSPVSYFMIAFQESVRAAVIAIAANHRFFTDVIRGLINTILIIMACGVIFYLIFRLSENYIASILHVENEFKLEFIDFSKQMILINLMIITPFVILNAFIFGIGFKKISLFSNLLNCTLAALLLFFQVNYLHQGVQALAASSAISGALSCLSIAIFLSLKKLLPANYGSNSKSDIRLTLKYLIHIGVPCFFSYVTVFCGLVAFNSILSAYGIDIVSGYYIAYRLQAFLILPAISIGFAMGILLSKEIASNNRKKIFSIIVIGSAVSTTFYRFAGELVYFLRENIVKFFTSSYLVKQSAVEYIYYVAPTYWLLGTTVALLTMLEQIGRGFNSLFFNFLFFFGLYLFGHHLALSHHSYLSFYQAISCANHLSFLLVAIFVLLLSSRRKNVYPNQPGGLFN